MKSTRIFSSPCLSGLPPWLAHPVGVFLVMLLFVSSSALGAEDGDFFYEPAGVGGIVTGYRGSGGAVVIPERLGGLPVTSIGDYAFRHQASLTSVTIPNSVTSIGDGAFVGCTGLTSVTIPDSVTTIGGYRRSSDCEGLTSVTIPNSVTTSSVATGLTMIPNSVLWLHWGLTSVTIPNSVTSIGQSAFSGCTGLTSVTIPNSVTRIEWRAFSGCTGLTSVTIPNSVTTIGESAFHGCTGLTRVTIPNSVTSIGGMRFLAARA
jgi:hypothetical protein